ncbi:hypothetical protein DPMN_133242 [Dreissena polymorpha]|uniref:Uncharacterized protein n=1 Tax=Dreissena polymorpha TaxID=45954 RepID=A0A9D4JAS9_DREPO|nr:hypothetical protein DPMN_133242 [Dreissena polymorpha]
MFVLLKVLLPVSEVTFGFGEITVNASGRVVTSNAYNLIREDLNDETLLWNQSWVAVCVEDINPEYVMGKTTNSAIIWSMAIRIYSLPVLLLAYGP